MPRSKRGTPMHLCLMQDGHTYKIIKNPRARDGVYIAYGPWYRDKCEWWGRMIGDHIKLGKPLDMSRHADRTFMSNKPKPKPEVKRKTNA